jgi:CRP-like cAMP-binding protein
VLFSVLFFTLYLPFAQAASEHFPDADALAGFFGLFWAGTTAAAFLVSILATNRLFAWFGVAAMVVVLPVLYATAFGVLLVTSGFVTLVVLRFSLGTWLQGVSSPGWEALVNVVPEGRRDQTRAFLNGGPTQIGTVIAGVLALVGQHSLTLRGFAVIGLVTALLTLGATIGIRRSYAGALVDALRAGRPQVFEGTSSLHSPVEFGADADVVRVLAGSMRSTDVRERRLAFQLVADLLADARPDAAEAAADDDDPIVRRTAVRMLDVSTGSGRDRLLALVLDSDTTVAAAAAARGLVLTGESAPEARMAELLRDPDSSVRRAAVEALTMAPPDRAADLASRLLGDPAAEVRAAAVEQVAAAPSDRSLQPVIDAVRDPDPEVRLAAGRALGSAPGSHVEEVLAALAGRETMDAGIEAIRHIELDGHRDRVREFVRSASVRATGDRDLAAAIPVDADARALLRDAVLDRGRAIARSALWAATTLATRRVEMATAIEHLDGPPPQLANALETLEAAGDPALVRPLLSLWEAAAVPRGGVDWLARALEDDDELIRRCAEFIRAEREGGSVPDSVTALSVIERVLFLRRVSLFSELAPPDLERLALLVEERGYGDGEVIADQGEMGEELHIVVAGAIRVVQEQQGSEVQLARRTEGEVVGEMSLITRTPRIATLVADGPVRTIRVGQREFASILRERPGVALAVMRVLADRLQEAGLQSDRPIPDLDVPPTKE